MGICSIINMHINITMLFNYLIPYERAAPCCSHVIVSASAELSFSKHIKEDFNKPALPNSEFF